MPEKTINYKVNALFDGVRLLSENNVDLESLNILLLVAKEQPIREIELRKKYGFSNSKLNLTLQFLKGQKGTKANHKTNTKPSKAFVHKDVNKFYQLNHNGRKLIDELFSQFSK